MDSTFVSMVWRTVLFFAGSPFLNIAKCRIRQPKAECAEQKPCPAKFCEGLETSLPEAG
jgi:hypothetical protein